MAKGLACWCGVDDNPVIGKNKTKEYLEGGFDLFPSLYQLGLKLNELRLHHVNIRLGGQKLFEANLVAVLHHVDLHVGTINIHEL